MSGWSVATEVAIWVLIGGSALVFGWFLVEVVRMARRGPPAPPPPDDGFGDEPRQ